MFLVSDLARAVAFYHDVLGLPCEIESAEFQWAEFDCGNVTLSLKGNSIPKGNEAGGRIALAVDSVQEAYETLTSRGVHLEGAPINSGFCLAFELHDPDGNLIILHQRIDGSCGQFPRNGRFEDTA